MDVHVVDPASVARAHMAIWTAVAATGLFSALIVGFASRRTWWLVALVALLVPTIVTFFFGGRPEFSFLYLPDVLLPNALVVGVPSTSVGSIVGWAVRRWRRRGAPSQVS